MFHNKNHTLNKFQYKEPILNTFQKPDGPLNMFHNKDKLKMLNMSQLLNKSFTELKMYKHQLFNNQLLFNNHK